MPEYERKTYGTGFTLRTNPPDRAEDVMHYLLTGQLFCGRSLNGVTWVAEYIDDQGNVITESNGVIDA